MYSVNAAFPYRSIINEVEDYPFYITIKYYAAYTYLSLIYWYVSPSEQREKSIYLLSMY